MNKKVQRVKEVKEEEEEDRRRRTLLWKKLPTGQVVKDGAMSESARSREKSEVHHHHHLKDARA